MSGANWQQREERKRRAVQRGKERVLGLIAIVFGAGMLAYLLSQGGPQGEGGFYIGQMMGWVFGVVFLVGGLYFVVRKSGRPPTKKLPPGDDQPGAAQ